MADDADISSIRVEQEINHKIFCIRNRIGRVAESLKDCEECGNPIPEARRKLVAGCTTCVDCQTRLERKSL